MARAVLIWAALVAAIAVPLLVAAGSPLLQWRQPVYIAAGFAGIAALGLLLVQPLLAGNVLPGLDPRRSRWIHQIAGIGLVAAVVVHVAGLWVTSPPDVIDALTFSSPTPFSVWGVIAMWAVFAAALVAALRRRFRPRFWRLAHSFLIVVVVIGTVVHAVLIEGTMGTGSKIALCGLVIVASAKVLIDLRVWTLLRRRRA
ncbi:MAG: ferric reductase-like transmembrane domain-containing protein [Pseudomonadota bacterium]